MTSSTDRAAYAFACLRCGHGWEQTYAVRHATDPHGRPFLVYYRDGHPVPSPLTNPTCPLCGAHRVRVLPPGKVTATTAARRYPLP
ncbi:hypothetical protein RM780_19340 [Streptomyces sp. DSM 44917]|uniref:C2H2-type domain-containing protein n=1 Tax=Streptomyces boetiae TaxID=3075541 RepID=A0ABU2LC03_9ACTN|nr:hypothetical protein [Streptomyces sp. DSM 44917]MDT0309099.1 hypothetical protein [Streptomyces sp. DSM 44917]